MTSGDISGHPFLGCVCIIDWACRHDKNLLMNRAAMRITASLLLWYLLSTMSIEKGGGPPRAWDLSLIPHSSSLLAGVIIMWTSPYLWNIIAWLVSTQVLFQQGLIVLLFQAWMPRLACYLYSVSVYLSVSLYAGASVSQSCWSPTPLPPNAQPLPPPIYCRCSGSLL